MGPGFLSCPAAATAGSAAYEQAVGGRDDPGLLVVFASDAYDLPALLAAVRSSTPDVPLIGYSTAGEIARSGAGDSGVVVMALGGEGFVVATAAASVTDLGLREAGCSVARAADRVADSAHRVLLVLSDGLAGDQEEIVRGPTPSWVQRSRSSVVALAMAFGWFGPPSCTTARS